MLEDRIRVAVADDHPLIRLAIEQALSDVPMIECIGSASDSTELFALLERQPCDVVVTDYAMPGGQHGDGMLMLLALRSRFPQVSIIVVTSLDQPVLIQLLRTGGGVEHIISKADDVQGVATAIIAAHARRPYLSPSISRLLLNLGDRPVAKLSPREQQVLLLYVSGESINAIADRLGLRKQTVSTQKVSAMQKLGIESDAQLYRFAFDLGLKGDGAVGA